MLAAYLCRWGRVLKHFHHLDTHWTCANHGVPSDHILRCHLVEESPSILQNSHILHTCQPRYYPLRHLNPIHTEWSDHEPTCPLQVQQHWHMYSAIPQNAHTPSVAFIEIVSVPFVPTFHIHVNQAIPHKDIRLLDMLLKTKWTWHSDWQDRLLALPVVHALTNTILKVIKVIR